MSITIKFFRNPVVLSAMIIAVIFCGCTDTKYCGDNVLTDNQFCHGGITYEKCGGKEYDPSNASCVGGKVLSVKVVFDANGATGVPPEPIWAEKGSSIVLPSKGSLSKEGYPFDGWSIYPDFFEMVMNGYFEFNGITDFDKIIQPAGAKFNVGSNSTLTLYAVWVGF